MEGDFTQPVNIGNPDEYTIKDFATLIQQKISPGAQQELIAQ
jgi:UDP-glucuronate decarboxylase